MVDMAVKAGKRELISQITNMKHRKCTGGHAWHWKPQRLPQWHISSYRSNILSTPRQYHRDQVFKCPEYGRSLIQHHPPPHTHLFLKIFSGRLSNKGKCSNFLERAQLSEACSSVGFRKVGEVASIHRGASHKPRVLHRQTMRIRFSGWSFTGRNNLVLILPHMRIQQTIQVVA